MNAGILYIYCTSFQKVDEEEYGGAWELTKEGFMTSFAGFLVSTKFLWFLFALVGYTVYWRSLHVNTFIIIYFDPI